MPQPILDKGNVRSCIKQMHRNRMPQCVAAAALWYLGLPDCLFDGFL